jgi:hypothetical protein
MSDPRYTDPRLSDPPLRDDTQLERVKELDRSGNAMWGWIAGGAVLALILVFVFARGPDATNTATTNMDRPAATTGTSAPRMPAETTGQATPRPAPSTPAPAATPAPSPTPPASGAAQ